jgi:hypothetical protein
MPAAGLAAFTDRLRWPLRYANRLPAQIDAGALDFEKQISPKSQVN